MPFSFPDLMVRDTIRGGFEALRLDPSLSMDDVFKNLPGDQASIASRYFAEHAVPVKLGWPREVAELPGVFVMLHQATETRTPLGGEFADPADTIGETGTIMSSTVRAMCLVNGNADLAVWISTAALWSLLASRLDMESRGLAMEQQVTLSDLRPAPEWMPDFAFGRDVTLSVVSPATALKRYQLVEGVLVRATTEDGDVREISIRR